MKNSLNLNEIVVPSSFGSIRDMVEHVEKLTDEKFDRVHLGSNFCSQYFLAMAKFFLNHPEVFNTDLPITLTVPIFSQKNLNEAKSLISELLKTIDNIDEITVNDLGMYRYLKDNYNLNLGRLFFKDTRDFRVEEYTLAENFPNLSDFIEENNNLIGVELDNFTEEIDLGRFPENVEIAVHTPLTYQSTGNICKFASINKPVEKKFRPNDNCALECAGIYEHYREIFGEKENIDDNLTDIFRVGRTIYFYNDNTTYKNRQPDRRIYFPLRELKNRTHEDINTF